jgi:ABC-type sugar transport system ATPase subunit
MEFQKTYRFEEVDATVEVSQRENSNPSVNVVSGGYTQKVFVLNRDVDHKEVIIIEDVYFNIDLRLKNLFVKLVEALDKEGLLDVVKGQAVADYIAKQKAQLEAPVECVQKDNGEKNA